MKLQTRLVVGLVVWSIVNVCLLIALILEVTKTRCTDKRSFKQSERIIGGYLVPISSYPFMAAIVIKKHGTLRYDALQCGSAIISFKWVVTAAHCLSLINTQKFQKELVYISSGSAEWRKGNRHDVANWISHNGYENNFNDNDIALISVKQAFIYKYEKALPIASIGYRYKNNTQLTVIGWGYTSEKEARVQIRLRGVSVNIITHSDCARMLGTLTKSMFCAGVPKGGKDACQFDSGGPIFEDNLLIGVVSWGLECGVKNQPGVYTKVSLYEHWIKETSKKLGNPIHAIFKDKP